MTEPKVYLNNMEALSLGHAISQAIFNNRYFDAYIYGNNVLSVEGTLELPGWLVEAMERARPGLRVDGAAG